MSPRSGRDVRRGTDRPAGIDHVTEAARHAATAVVLAKVDEGTLTRDGAREILEMLGIVDAAGGLTADGSSTVVQ